MAMPDDGLALLKAGQGVKLLYDAFPYQRFGTRRGVVRWVGPSGIKRDSTGLPFRVLIDLDSPTIAVSGEQRELVPGMGGRADIVVGRRALISYLFEPIRQLRENVADAPAAPAGKSAR
jgi:membrane fusion protein